MGVTSTMMGGSTSLLTLTLTLLSGVLVAGCNMKTKEVGVCLHVYLERDFLTMEGIVYPRRTAERRNMIYNNLMTGAGALREWPMLPELDNLTTEASVRQRPRGRRRRPGRRHRRNPDQEGGEEEDEEAGNLPTRRKGRHHHQLQSDNQRRASNRTPIDNYAVVDAYGQHGWVEGPELEDYCRKQE